MKPTPEILIEKGLRFISSAWDLDFTVPLLPPSVNHYKVRRYYNSGETKAYIAAVCVFARAAAEHHLAGDGVVYEVDLTFAIPRTGFYRWDTNNFWKVALDALVHARVIRDDRYIVEEHARKELGGGTTRYRIRGYNLDELAAARGSTPCGDCETKSF